MAKKKKQSTDLPTAPSQTLENKAKDWINERLRASKKVVNARKTKWQVWEKMYKNQQILDRAVGESNLVLPKADYIVEVISSKIINTLFSVSSWLTMKHPSISPDQMRDRQKWFMMVMDRKVNFYLTAIELFKSSPIKGTSICKTYSRDFWPRGEYLPLESFYPDVLASRPGDIQSMRYCMHQFKRDFNQLNKFISPISKQSIYFNLDKLKAKLEAMKGKPHKLADGTIVEDRISPPFDLIEYHGEFEFKPNHYAEFIITGTLEDENSEKVDEIIRMDPATLKSRDQFTGQDVYLKPFVASIYSVNPGEFYGKSAVSSVESLINEQTDLHNIYMDNHKRVVNSITKVLNRSDLTRDDLPQVPGAMWFMDSFEDVDMETPQEVNLLAYKAIHDLLDREIEKTSSVTAYNLGVGKSKRETYGEVRSMLSESGDRFQLFIQMADRLTLRPFATRIYELLRQTFGIFKEKDFMVDGQKITINEESLLEDMDVSFAATTIESEYSKYSKQQTFPEMVRLLAEIAGSRLNVDEVATEMGELFNYKQPERFLHQSETIPIAALPQELQPIAQQILQMMQEQQKGGGGGQAQTPSLNQGQGMPVGGGT